MTKTGRAKQIFKPEFQFGLRGVPLGNEFEVVTDEDAIKMLEASWNAGVRLLRCVALVWTRLRRTTIRYVPAQAAARQLCDLHEGRKAAQGLAT